MESVIQYEVSSKYLNKVERGCSPQNIIVKFPATVIVGGAAQIKNIKVRVYLSNASLRGFFFFTSRKDTKKTRDTLFSALYTCVYSSSFRLARVVIVPATNCLANVIMPLVLYLLFFRPFVSQKSVIIAVFSTSEGFDSF